MSGEPCASATRAQRPSSMLHHPGVGREQRDGQPLGDCQRRVGQTQDLAGQPIGVERTGGHEGHRPFGEGALGEAGESDHAAPRRSGRVMQRGPPPPRTSSSPSIVITVRCLVSSQSSKATKSTPETTRKPASRSASTVSSFRR